ncbi:MAG: fused MFS/spermidine synthase [Acidobacteriota bacterium]
MRKWNRIEIIIAVLFLLSGAAGLIYQVVWTRMLILVFGNTMLATSTVLSAFMAGLALGSYTLGRYVDALPRSLLHLYAVLEAGIGVFALVFPQFQVWLTPLYTSAYQSFSGNLPAINLIRFLLCFGLILVPTFLMGGTLPVLVKYVHSAGSGLGRRVGRLYGLNTAGAMAGTVVSGFWLLGTVGMRVTTWVGVALNLGVAVSAWLCAGRMWMEDSVPPRRAKKAPGEEALALPQATVNLVLLGSGLAGFCSLAYEVLWTRMLNLFFHNTVFSFTTILATFLAGIALGSLLYARWLSSWDRPAVLFVACEAGIGVLSYATPFVFDLLYQPVFAQSGQLYTVLKAGLIMVAPATLMGIALPLAVQICQRGPSREGQSVGRVYAINTVGSILGSFAAGFILLPHLGIVKSIVCLATLNILAGLLVIGSLPSRRTRWAAIAPLGLFAAAIIAFTPPELFRRIHAKSQPDADILCYQEGRIANVTVYDFYKEGYKDLYLNGIEEASSRLWHVQLFKMLGVLPAIMHPNPDDALMIAFGAGMSAGACAGEVSSLECAELNPDVQQEGRIFAVENLRVLDNPKLELTFNDGRNHLLLTPKKYSLIVSDATNPVAFDSWTLYTREFYELCKSKLRDGGVFCQWIPIPLPGDSLQVILKSFQSVFPHASFWSIYGCSQCLMLGTPERLQIDYQEISRRLPATLKRSELDAYGVDTTEKFLSFFMLGEDELRRYLRDTVRMNTDDLPLAQFHARIFDPEGIQASVDLLKNQTTIAPYLKNMPVDRTAVLRRLADYQFVSEKLNLGYFLQSDNQFKLAEIYVEEANMPKDANIASVLSYDWVRRDYFVSRVRKFPDDANAQNTLGFLLWQNGDLPGALLHLRRAVQLKPDFVQAWVNLTTVEIDSGEYESATANLLALRKKCPSGRVLQLARSDLNIIRLLRRVTFGASDPDVYRALGDALRESGLLPQAFRAYRSAAALGHEDPKFLLPLAGFLEAGDFLRPAVDIYKEVLQRQPDRQDLADKIRFLESMERDPQARLAWMEEKIKPAEQSDQHPEGCLRAFKAWNDFPFGGTIAASQLREAAREFDQVTGENPQHMHAYSDAAQIYEYLGEYRLAAERWRQGLAASPGNRLANIQAQRLDVLAAGAPPNSTGSQAAGWYNQAGVSYWQAGEPEEAVVYLKKALALDPGNAEVLANLGANYIETGQFREAVRCLEDALRASPDLQYAPRIQQSLEWLRSVVGSQVS